MLGMTPQVMVHARQFRCIASHASLIPGAQHPAAIESTWWAHPAELFIRRAKASTLQSILVPSQNKDSILTKRQYKTSSDHLWFGNLYKIPRKQQLINQKRFQTLPVGYCKFLHKIITTTFRKGKLNYFNRKIKCSKKAIHSFLMLKH